MMKQSTKEYFETKTEILEKNKKQIIKDIEGLRRTLTQYTLHLRIINEELEKIEKVFEEENKEDKEE